MSPTPTPDPSAGLPLEDGAKAILNTFTTAPPPSGWVEVLLAPFDDGTLPTSYALEDELRFQAKKAFHALDLQKVKAELVWVERAGLPVRMQAGCIYRK